MAFFSNYPIVNYQFGDAEEPAIFQNLSVYLDLIDQVQDDVSFYQTVNILDGERPDTLSQKIYGTPDYYWMFYLLNDSIRIQGWPLRYQDMLTAGRERYPNRVLTTDCTNELGTPKNEYFTFFAQQFTVGNTVRGRNTGALGTIIERNLDLGQLVVNVYSGQFSGTEFVEVDYAGDDNLNTRRVKLLNNQLQYNATHHFEDSNQQEVDVNPFNNDTSRNVSGRIRKTYLERFEDENESLKSIRCFTPEVANQVNAEYQKLLRTR